MKMHRYRYYLELSLKDGSNHADESDSDVVSFNFGIDDKHDSGLPRNKLTILYVNSIQLYEETTNEDDVEIDYGGDDRFSRRSRSQHDGNETPMLAINIPPSILCLIEEQQQQQQQQQDELQKEHQRIMDDTLVQHALIDILPKIHPYFAYFEPYILLRSLQQHSPPLKSILKSKSTKETLYLRRNNNFDILLLKLNVESFHASRKNNGESILCSNEENANSIKEVEYDDEKKIISPSSSSSSNYYQTLIDIVQEINGEPMGVSQSCVIQTLPISQVQINNGRNEDKERSVNAISQTLETNNKQHECSNKHNDDNVQHQKHRNHRMAIPLCPVCRFRIEPARFIGGIRSEVATNKYKKYNSTRAQHHQAEAEKDIDMNTKCTSTTENDYEVHIMKFLSPWIDPNYCVACHVLQERSNLSSPNESFVQHEHLYQVKDEEKEKSNNNYEGDGDELHCYKCGMKETLWVCLTCGVVGCGRYSHGHAESHYQRTAHPFSLELATQRIWDYSTSSFVNREDVLNFHFMQDILGVMNNNSAAYINTSRSNDSGYYCCDNSDNQFLNPYCLSDGTIKPKKTAVVGEEYEILLQSALEDQAQHFELEIAHLTAQLASETADKDRATSEQMYEILGLENDIEDLKREVDVLKRECINIQSEEAEHRAKSNLLLREQGVSKQLLEKIRQDASHEHEEGKRLVEDLEQQISDLTANLKMRRQISHNHELSNAQIYGTSSEQQKSKGSKRKGRRKK